MKILFALTFYPPATGGAEIKAARLAGALAARGHEVTVLARRLPGTPPLEESNGVRVIRLGRETGKSMDWPAFIGGLRGFAPRADVIHNFLLSSLSNICCAAGAFYGKPVFISVGGTGAYGGMKDKTAFGRLAGLKWRHIAASRAVFIAPGEMSRAELRAAAIKPERIEIINNPVDLEKFTPPSPEERKNLKAKLAISGGAFIFTGRLAEPKALDRLLKAWAAADMQRKGATLLLAGAGPLREELVSLADSLGVSKSARFAGVVPDVREYLRACEFFTLSSRSEGMSNALLEAMSCGLVPIATRVSGTDMISDGGNGFMVANTDDVSALSAALAAAAAVPPEQLAAMSRAARNTMENGYSLDSVCGKLEALYLRAACAKKYN